MQPSAVEPILRTLVGFDTTSSFSNLPLIQWVEEYLRPYGATCFRVNESAGKASLLARIGPDAPGGIVLSGHTDVVPVTDQPWETDPFTLTRSGDRYVGRGTADMKSFLACALAWAPVWAQANLTRPVWLAFSHDEEIGCLGAAPMAQQIVERGIAPALVIVGEPTEMRLVNAHKGILSFETTVTGHAAHSSRPDLGANAIHAMSEIVHTLTSMAKRCASAPVAGSPFTPPYSTVHVGTINGGSARNIIANTCRIVWEIRPLPEENTEALLAEYQSLCDALDQQMRARFPTCGVTTRAVTNVRALRPEPEAAYTSLAMRLAQANGAQAVAFGTEGGIFQAHGLPVVVCGPGSIDQAHQANEWVAHSQLEACMAFLGRLGDA